MKVVSVVSASGGTGKTTLAASLAALLAADGRRVVAIDLSPQNALRLHLGVLPARTGGLAQALLARASWEGAMANGIDGVSVLPFGALEAQDQQRLERELDAEPQWFAHGLATLNAAAAEIVVVDTPPGASLFTHAALGAANLALNVVLADAASYAAIAQMQRLIETAAARRPEFIGAACVTNQADPARPLNKDVLRVLRDLLGERIYPGVIHSDEGVREALACNTTIAHYDASCQATADLRECAAWLRDRLNTPGLSQGSAA